MDSTPEKKPLSVWAWLGIGCGGLTLLAVIGLAIVIVKWRPNIEEFAQNFAKDPTRATVDFEIKMTGGQFEIIAQDEARKRYTLRDKKSGQLMTIYWDAKRQKPVTVPGDFSAIPADANPPAAPSTPGPN